MRNGTFTIGAPTAIGIAPDGFVSGDFDGDGALDLAVADETDGTVTILLGDGLGGFASFFVVNLPAGSVSLCLSDFNGDGVLDLAATNMGDGTITVLIGSGI